MDWALPNELSSMVFSCLSTCKDLTSVARVNSTWNLISRSDYFWKFRSAFAGRVDDYLQNKAVLDGSFPHPYLHSQKDVPWRQVVQRHFTTKRNIIQLRCVQYTLGTRCSTPDPCVNMILRSHTVSGKHGLFGWELYRITKYEAIFRHRKGTPNDCLSPAESVPRATELWDLEKRTVVQILPVRMQNAMLYGQYLINDDVLPNSEYTATQKLFGYGMQHDVEPKQTKERLIRYGMFDPTQEIVDYVEKITPKDISLKNVAVILNEDANSSLVALTWEAGQRFVQVYDLRTGSRVYQKSFQQHSSTLKIYKNTLVLHITYDERKTIVVTNIVEDKEVILYDPVSCFTLLGNELWMVSSTEDCIIKYNIVTGARQQYSCKEDIKDATMLKIFDGIIWLCKSMRLYWIAVSASDCRVFGKLITSCCDYVQFVQMPNGAVTCLSSDYAHILSFRNEDIEQPIQVLQIEPNGQNKTLNMVQGDLNSLVRQHTSHLAVSSQIVFEDETQRYCFIFVPAQGPTPINSYADKARSWMDNVEHHKSAIFQQAYLESDAPNVISMPKNPYSVGPCWVFYETKVDGGWLRSSPPDQWHFFKSKLGIK